MPQYVNSAFQPPQLLQKGIPAYLFGAFSQQRGNTLLGLSTDAIATNAATVSAQLVNGPLPNIGDLVSIINAANSAGAFNVNRAPLTAAGTGHSALRRVPGPGARSGRVKRTGTLTQIKVARRAPPYSPALWPPCPSSSTATRSMSA